MWRLVRLQCDVRVRKGPHTTDSTRTFRRRELKQSCEVRDDGWRNYSRLELPQDCGSFRVFHKLFDQRLHLIVVIRTPEPVVSVGIELHFSDFGPR